MYLFYRQGGLFALLGMCLGPFRLLKPVGFGRSSGV